MPGVEKEKERTRYTWCAFSFDLFLLFQNGAVWTVENTESATEESVLARMDGRVPGNGWMDSWMD